MDQQTKETMQNTIKTLEDRSKNIEKILEKGNDVIVLDIGSHTIKYGLANQSKPRKICNLIGYKLENSQSTCISEINENLQESNENFDNICLDAEIQLKMTQNIRQEKPYKGKQKNKQEIDLQFDFDAESDFEEVPEKSEQQIDSDFEQDEEISDQEDISQKEKPKKKIQHIQSEPILLNEQKNSNRDVLENYIFGKDIYKYEQNKQYIIRKPIRYGMFNLKDYNSEKQVICDIQNIILYITVQKLKISRRKLKNYSVILVLPDNFIRSQTKALVNILLKNIGFQALYLHLSSVVACFGACMSQACVVDIGAEKININCIDEGLIVPGTNITKYMGGDDINLAFLQILKKKSIFAKSIRFEPHLYGDMFILDKLKEKGCSFKQMDDQSNKIFNCEIFRENGIEFFSIPFNESFIISPGLFYHAKAFNELSYKIPYKKSEFYNPYSKYFDDLMDHEDYYDDFGIITSINQTMQILKEQQQKEIEQQNQQSQQNQQNAQKQKSQNLDQKTKQKLEQQTQNNKSQESYEKKLGDQFFMQNLDELVCYSINQIKDQDLRKKMANSILLLGGTAQMRNFVDDLEDKLINRIQEFDQTIERIEVIDTKLKDISPIDMSWVGASIIAKLESMRDLWINRVKWLGLSEIEDEGDNEDDKKIKRDKSNEVGLNYLKEKVPFQW